MTPLYLTQHFNRRHDLSFAQRSKLALLPTSASVLQSFPILSRSFSRRYEISNFMRDGLHSKREEGAIYG